MRLAARRRARGRTTTCGLRANGPRRCPRGSDNAPQACSRRELTSHLSSQPTIESFLIPSKTRVPDVRAGTIRRHALVERLLNSEERIISVTAPGGYGKSLLLAEWASEDLRPVAWLSLDPDDSDTTLFLQYVALALVQAEILEADQLPSSVGMANTRSLLPALRSALATRRPFVLVVDDTQWLRGDALDALLLLARDIPSGSQLVLCGRSDLGRLLSRGRLAGETLELTARDLALDNTEARQLFESMDVDLSDVVVDDANRRVEGWVAGLYLCALATRETGSLPEFGDTHSDRFVSDYFEAEMARLPEAQLDFLRESSALIRMCPELCDAALSRGDSREMLESIEGSNLFLAPLDHERVWFRYHDLFRAALLRQLEKSDASARNRIRRSASEWCEIHGSADYALRYALAAGDDDRSARLLCTIGIPLYQLGRATMIEECLARFDDPVLITKHPAVSVLAAFFHTLSGRPFQAERWADAAVRGLRDDDPLPDGSPNARLWVATIEALMCRHGPEQMHRDAQSAIAGLPRPSPMLGLAVWTHATSSLLTGDLVEGERHLAAMIEVATATGNHLAVMTAYAQLALLALGRGDDDRARELLELARPAENIEDYQGYIHFALIAAAEARVEVEVRQRRGSNRAIGHLPAPSAAPDARDPLVLRPDAARDGGSLLRPRRSQRCARRPPGRSRDPPPPARPRHPRATRAATSGEVGGPRRRPFGLGVVADNCGAAAPPAAHDPPDPERDRGTARCLLQHREDTNYVDLQEARRVVPERGGSARRRARAARGRACLSGAADRGSVRADHDAAFAALTQPFWPSPVSGDVADSRPVET